MAQSKKRHPVETFASVMVVCAVVAFRAWVVAMLWNWFVQPLGAPALTTMHALGLLALWAGIKPVQTDVKASASLAFGNSVASLVIGWVIHFGVTP